MKYNNYPLSRKTNLVVQELKNEVLIYDLSINKAYCLNHTSALIWGLCDGTKSVDEISRAVGKKLKTEIDESLVWLALDQLKTEQLLQNSENFLIDFAGMTRREVIRKIGLASLVAIPVILAVRAPVAAQANSICGGAVCTCPTVSTTITPDRIGEVCLVSSTACPDGCKVCRHSGTLGTNEGTCYPVM